MTRGTIRGAAVLVALGALIALGLAAGDPKTAPAPNDVLQVTYYFMPG
jgi:hypothetical protein